MDSFAKTEQNTSEFDLLQLEEIRSGAARGLDVSIYAKHEYSSFLMHQLRKGLEAGIDLSPYVGYEVGILYQIRKAFLAHIDLLPYVKSGYDKEQLTAIRAALTKHLDIDPYLNLLYHGSCIKEIAIGLEHGLDVSIYADVEYTWRKMREIRLGLENQVDVSQYLNKYYSYLQMREIRLGLEAGIDVSSFKSLMYTAKVMRSKRLLLENTIGKSISSGQFDETKLPYCTLYISKDGMFAFLEVTDPSWKPTAAFVRLLLENHKICYGIDDVGIAEIVSAVNTLGKKIKVAEGKQPQNGQDGYYCWNFDSHLITIPQETSDGSADFKAVRWFERVSMGQPLATYYAATDGVKGISVTGTPIPVKRGKELPQLTGTGFRILRDQRTYIAAADGHVRLRGLQITVEDLLILDAKNLSDRKIDFHGSIYMDGDLENDFLISATGDIVIDGCVGNATLISKRSILIRKGMNAVNGTGYVKASEDIVGGYFESAKLDAGKNIYLTSSLNSDLNALGAIVSIGKKGGIVGGSAYAEKGFCISNAGNMYGKQTCLKCGVVQEVEDQYDRILLKKTCVANELKKLQDAYQNICNRYSPSQRMEMDIYLKLEDAIYCKNEELKKLNKQITSIKQRIEKAARTQIIIDCNLYQNVSVVWGNQKFSPKQQEHSTIRHEGNHFLIEKLYA